MSSPEDDDAYSKSAMPSVDDVNSIPIASPHRRRHRHHGFPGQQPQVEPMEPMSEPFIPVTMDELNRLITDDDDYYTNPLVSHTVFDSNDPAIDELDRMISMLTQSLLPSAATQPQSSSFATTLGQQLISLPSMLRPDVSSQSGASFPSDPYSVHGKVVKNARFYVESITIPQNSNWSGGIDYLEEGRLIGFSITCNDSDIKPIVFIENASGTQDIINDMSFRQAVQHGRGMTLSEATSTFMTPGGLVSRDVSGQPSQVFPYIKRYKDQLTGDGVYNDVKNTEDDKSYVMNFEPTTSIPYQRLSFQVFNGSTLGSRMINRLEIKRLVYVDPDPLVSSTVVPSDLSQISTALNMLATNMGGGARVTLPPEPVATSNFASAAQQQQPQDVFNKIYSDFIRFAYSQLQAKTEMKFEDNKIHISELEEQKKIQELERMVDGEEEEKPPALALTPNKRSYDSDTLLISWE